MSTYALKSVPYSLDFSLVEIKLRYYLSADILLSAKILAIYQQASARPARSGSIPVWSARLMVIFVTSVRVKIMLPLET